MIRIYFLKGRGWFKPGEDATPPDFVANDPDELLALADGSLDQMLRDVLRAVARRMPAPVRPVDVIANAAVFQILPRA